MRIGRVLAHRISSLLRRSRVEADLRRELDLHIEQLTKEYAAGGMGEREARLAALREFGSVEVIKEGCRDMRRVNAVEDLFRDLVYAVRLAARSPGFTLTAVLSLALGIGANTAIFSVVDTVLLRMLPVPEPGQLVEITRPGGGTLSYPFFEAIRDRSQVFSGVLLLSSGLMTGDARRGGADFGEIHVSPVSGGYFRVLGVAPVLGRPLTEGDMDASNVVVIGYEFWQRAFGGDPAVLGKVMRVGTGLYSIVGVAPAGFTGVAAGQPVDAWIPVTRSNNRVAFIFRVIARRKAGVPESKALADVELIARRLSAEWGFDRPMQVEIAPAGGGLTKLRRRFAFPLLVLMTVSGLVLLMAALNIANLLLARASTRQREIGVRLSLGAGRWRLVRQLLTESFVLGGAGGVLGLVLAPAFAAFLVRFLSSASGPMELPFRIDAPVLAFTTLTSIAVVFLFGTAPAWAATRFEPSALSKRGGSRSPVRPGRLLVLAQVAISCVLLAGAVLFARSLKTLAEVDLGFNPDNLVLVHLGTAAEGPRGVARVRLFERVLKRLAAVSGVRSVAMSSENLFSRSTWTETVSAPGFTPRQGMDRRAVLLAVSAGFFRTMGIAMIQGRDFESRDNENAPRVAVVNEAMARYYFGDANPVGRTFRFESSDFPTPLTVVGVVRNAKYESLKESWPRMVYLPALQTPGPFGGTDIAVRTAANPVKMADLLWEAARSESPYLRFGGSTTQERLVEGSIAQDRMLAELSGFFGLSAAVLVCLGLYGLTAYQVSRRRAEIGVRIALGAQRRDVMTLVIKDAVAVVAGGAGLGLCGALGLARLVQGLLFGVHAFGGATLLAAPAILVGVGVAAAYWPARRAARLDPMRSRRYE